MVAPDVEIEDGKGNLLLNCYKFISLRIEVNYM